MVSRGAEKNFREFMVALGDRDDPPVVDESAFRDSVAKAILFRRAERVVGAENYGGYRANIVTYTIAKLVDVTDGRVDLRAIWRAQDLSPALVGAVADLSRPVQHALVTPPNNANIGEWCKNAKAWVRVQGLSWTVPSALAAELLDLTTVRNRTLEQIGRENVVRAEPIIRRAAAVPATTWAEVAAWAKHNDQLEAFQRGLAANLGKRAERGAEPNERQAQQGITLLQEAVRAGFRPQQALADGVLEP